jgi:HD-GYP domain-containing protein (c-di-GMP phosphodiesterase class II)
MGHCVLLVDDPLLEDVYSLNLKMYTDTDSLIKRTSEEVIALFEHIPGVDLIIIKETSENSKAAKEILEFLEDTDRNYIPKILVGDDRSSSGYNAVLERGSGIKELVKASAKLLGITAKDIATRLTPEFMPIPSNYFKSLKKVNVDIYKRSVDENGKAMYYKTLDAHADVPNEFAENMIKTNHRNLFILSKDRLKFTNFYTQQMIARVQETEDPGEKAQLLESAMSYIQESIGENLNISEEVMEMADVSIKETLKMIEDSNALKHFMKNLLDNTNGFGFRHCQMITYIAFHILDKVDWGSREQQEKLSFVAFFHDIVLQNEKMMKVHTQLDLDSVELEEKEHRTVEHHAYLAADLVSRLPNCPIGADQIIKQHHGAQNGVGFPKEFHHSLMPLSMVFMVAEEFVHAYLKTATENYIFSETLARIRRKFPDKGHWKKIIEALALIDVE